LTNLPVFVIFGSMKNENGVTMRKRRNKSGTISWQVDYGMVDGKRLRKSFPSKQAAAKSHLAVFKSRLAGLGEIDEEKSRLRELAREQAVKLAALERELSRLRCYKAGNECPLELQQQPHVFELPHASSGVYFLCDAERKILYVGMSKDVPARVSRHRQRGVIRFEIVFMIPYAESELFEMESWWIKKLQPPCNGEAPVQFQTEHCSP
jgi:hypothetical protein